MKSNLASGLETPNSLNFCRFVLASTVILSHSYALLGPAILRLEPMVRLSGRLGLGTLAVDLFFVLSGFLVSASYCRQPNLKAYLRKRALRIYPGLICSLVLSAFVVAPLGGAQASLGDFFSYIYRPLLLQSLPNIPGAFVANPLQYVNGSLWTIRFEMFCYLLVPLMAWLGCYQRPKRVGLFFYWPTWDISSSVCRFPKASDGRSVPGANWNSCPSSSATLWPGPRATLCAITCRVPGD